MQAEAADSLLYAARCKAGHSIADALCRQRGKKAQVLESAGISAQARGDATTQRKSAQPDRVHRNHITCSLAHQLFGAVLDPKSLR